MGNKQTLATAMWSLEREKRKNKKRKMWSIPPCIWCGYEDYWDKVGKGPIEWLFILYCLGSDHTAVSVLVLDATHGICVMVYPSLPEAFFPF